MAEIIALANEKGGVGKTTTCINLGIGLARQGRKVLLADIDPQGSLTAGLGFREPDKSAAAAAMVMENIMKDNPPDTSGNLLRHGENVDLLPANTALAGVEIALVNAVSRETVLKQYIETVKQNYDYILLDCSPSLGMLTVNALAAADSVIIPVAPKYLDVKGLELLLKTVSKVQRQINPALRIGGIVVTMADTRTRYNRDIISLLEWAYKGKIKIFCKNIPQSVRVSEASIEGASIYKYAPDSKAASAYESLTREVLADERK
jgi:chromosome partitioning protein